MTGTDTPISAVDEIIRFNHDRRVALLKIKYARMAENVFAFFRGTDHLFAARWPQLRPTDAGPEILVCGDLHLENFGAYQTDDGDFRYDINDFDEALVAPCSFDLVRAATSILLAAEVWSISPVQASCIICDFLASYRATAAETFRTGRAGEVTLGQGQGPIWDLLGETAVGRNVDLLKRHTELGNHGKRRIIRSDDKHPEVEEQEASLVRESVEKHGDTTPTPADYRVLDVTGRILGIGSLGVRRYLVLVAGGGSPDTNRLLDVKEAKASSVAGCSDFPQPNTGGNEALRVVLAQRQLQSKPTAGLAAIEIDSRPFRLREVIPDENRSKLDRLQKRPDKLRLAVTVVGQLTLWSQFRGCAVGPRNTQQMLASWVAGPALDAILTSAVRAADATCQDFLSFTEAYASGHIEKHLHH